MSKLLENFNPIGIKSYLALQHIDRYRFALKHVRPGEAVLDIACGSGYGTMMLLNAGCNVMGADYDAELIHELRQQWNYSGFIQANALALPFPDHHFDAVISFETIEHVTDGQNFVAEMSRVLKQGGLFICSTPNINYTAHPKFHVKEYQPDEFFKLMERNFTHIVKFGQYFKPSDRINDLYHWHFISHLQHSSFPRAAVIWLLNRLLNLAASTKRLARHALKLPVPQETFAQVNIPVSLNQEADRLCRGQESAEYCVQNYKGSKWLRIMVTVARKD